MCLASSLVVVGAVTGRVIAGKSLDDHTAVDWGAQPNVYILPLKRLLSYTLANYVCNGGVGVRTYSSGTQRSIGSGICAVHIRPVKGVLRSVEVGLNKFCACNPVVHSVNHTAIRPRGKVRGVELSDVGGCPNDVGLKVLGQNGTRRVQKESA